LSVVLSLNGHFLLFLDSAGVGHCFSLAGQTAMWECRDQVDRVKFAHAVFDRNSEYVIVAPRTVALEGLRVFRVEDGALVKTFPGEREPILQLFSHPLDTTIYARCRSGIVHWEPSRRWRMKNSVPQVGLMRANAPFFEPEDFFDVPPPEEEPEDEATAPLKRCLVPLDLLIPVEPAFLPDDKDYPHQLLVLTWPPPPSAVVSDT
jgi:hypothetical protein